MTYGDSISETGVEWISCEEELVHIIQARDLKFFWFAQNNLPTDVKVRDIGCVEGRTFVMLQSADQGTWLQGRLEVSSRLALRHKDTRG